MNFLIYTIIPFLFFAKVRNAAYTRLLGIRKKNKKILKVSAKSRIIIGIIILIGVVNSKLNACSCDTISFREALEYADEIFVGKIIKAEKFKNGKFINADNQEEINWNWRYYFEIDKKWKGNNQSKLIIYHQGTSCDVWFDIYEREYLVYASRKSEKENPLGITVGADNGQERLSTWLCSRTTGSQDWEEGNWFKEDIEKLDREFPNEVQLSKFQINTNWLLIGLGFIGILVLTIRKIKNKNKELNTNKL